VAFLRGGGLCFSVSKKAEQKLHYSGRPRHRSGDDRVFAMFPVNRDCDLVLGVEISSTLLARADEMIE
jgi:hypothetical protein